MSAPIELPAPGAARSLWLQEALSADPGEPCPPLDAHVVADVCIVGGGFTGLWTAVRLREREPGLRIVLVEGDIVGGGASGRNGGFVSASWHDVEALVALFGRDEGLRYAWALDDAVEQIGAFLNANQIAAGFHRDGVLMARSGAWQPPPGPEQPARLQDWGVEDRILPRSAEQLSTLVRSPRLLDGYLVPGDGICQPALLARGLRRWLLERDVRIYERTPMDRLERSRPAVVRTSSGAVKAGKVVIATGAWAAGMRPFKRSFGLISDYVVATEPIPDRLGSIGWTSQVGLADARDWLYYLRPTDDGRIVIGGGAGGAIYGGKAGGRAATHSRRFASSTARGLVWLFPDLEGVRFTHAWGGPIDQTPTFLPFYRTLDPGNIHAALGFSGHGLTQTFVAGHILASTVLEVVDAWTSLPINRPELSLAPPEPLRWPLVAAAATALAWSQRRLDAGGRVGLLGRAIGAAPISYRERLVGLGSGEREDQ